ncbi:DUF4258 domain-containing protein [Alteromonas sediminis]|uniref:DUF4258 domain-containing protein n=1 Tax=Alteromonas sediminis TaxID=2259342 RepID=A0A3N5ZAQ5_9ALTE|nr:DUF4258 domain-containing protein [Alteromonas sediminis]
MLSTHAKIRMKQRGFSLNQVELIIRYGEERHSKGAFVYTCTKKTCQHLRDCGQSLKDVEKCRGSYAVVSDGIVITVAKIH